MVSVFGQVHQAAAPVGGRSRVAAFVAEAKSAIPDALFLLKITDAALSTAIFRP